MTYSDAGTDLAITSSAPAGTEAGDSAGAAAPFRETAASGPTCAYCGQVHPGGRFVAGCPGPRLRMGWHSALVRSGAATGQQDVLTAARLELRGELGDVGIVKGSLADAFVELGAVRDYLGGRLASEGPLTAKGRTRALLSAYLAVVDRQVRLAQVLGVERRAQSLPRTPSEALMQEPELS
jgi:hypothetical protein